MPQLLSQYITIGPFFANDTGPDLDVLFLWDAGGHVDLTGSQVDGIVRRWDPRRKIPVGLLITESSLTIVDAVKGEAVFDWTSGSPLSAVPVDPGWYMFQATVTFPTGKSQLSQRALFEVLPS